MTKTKLTTLYSDYVSCKRCFERNHKSSRENLLRGKGFIIPPKGFFFRSAPVDVLFVATNPGHPNSKTNEIDLYKNKEGEALYKTIYKYHITKTDLTRINSYINTKYDLKGYDKHIDQCLALIQKARLKINREIELGIIFHHGGWSRYRPHKTKGLPALLHSADMLASQVLGV